MHDLYKVDIKAARYVTRPFNDDGDNSGDDDYDNNNGNDDIDDSDFTQIIVFHVVHV